MNEKEPATEQLEEVSGRWLRDQLRGVAEETTLEPPEPEMIKAPAPKAASSSQLIEGLAASISAAVVEPIRSLEYRREEQQSRLEASLNELSANLQEASAEIATLREQVSSANSNAEAAKIEARREIEAARAEVKSEIEAARAQSKAQIDAVASEASAEIDSVRNANRQQIDQLESMASDLKSSFQSLAEEIGRLQEKVREQHERIDALRFRETQRAKAMNELARASSTLKEAVAAAAAMAGPIDDEHSTNGRP